MKTGVHMVKVAWLGTLVLRPRVRSLAIFALKSIDEEDVRSLLITLREMCKPTVMDEENRSLALGVIDAIERETGGVS